MTWFTEFLPKLFCETDPTLVFALQKLLVDLILIVLFHVIQLGGTSKKDLAWVPATQGRRWAITVRVFQDWYTGVRDINRIRCLDMDRTHFALWLQVIVILRLGAAVVPY